MILGSSTASLMVLDGEVVIIKVVLVVVAMAKPAQKRASDLHH